MALLLASTVYLGLLTFRSVPVPLPRVGVFLNSPYGDEPLLGDYDRLFKAISAGDDSALRRYVEGTLEGFLLYRTLLRLARDPDLPAGERLGYFDRVLACGLISPLARDDLRRAQLELAGVAEAAGRGKRAIAAYAEALPLDAAAEGLERLEPDARTLARIFLAAREPERALTALGEVSAPAVRAPAYAALGEYRSALSAYNRWLGRSPGSRDAKEGKLWALVALKRYGAARRLLDTLPPNPSAEAALAEARGDTPAVLAALMQMGSDEGLWEATRLLEEQGDPSSALPLYLELARGTSDYADDAAYRAYTLAKRLGVPTVTAEADARIPPFSYFGFLRGHTFVLPTGTLPRVTPDATRLSQALVRADDREAALGELLVALKRADDEATTIALAEALQELGEYGASTEAASSWLDRGSRARRTWLAAYPRAYRRTVETQAASWGLEPAFIWAVMRQESLFYPRAVSTSAAAGVMQIVPDTWSWLAELLGRPAADPFDVPSNVLYGAFYISRLIAQFGGSLPVSAAAYNGGPGYVERLLEDPLVQDPADFYRHISRAETREYVGRVMRNYLIYSALYTKTAGF